MTLRTTLQAPLGIVVRQLLADLGVSVTVLEPLSTAASDGSTATAWVTATGVTGPVKIYAAATTEQQRRTVWGQEIKAAFTGYAALSPVIGDGMILCPSEGPMAGRCFEVTRAIPDDIGQITTLALTEVPPLPGAP